MHGRTLAFLLLATLGVAPAGSQSQMRTLVVPATAAWKHAESEIILPPSIAGLTRTTIADKSGGELDVIAQYDEPGVDLTATIYLFRPQITSVPLWFDRSRAVLEHLRLKPAEVAAGTAATPFALPGGAAPSGLRIVYPHSADGYQSTGLAVAPSGKWVMKVRMSAKQLAPAELNAKLAEFTGAIRWPAAASTAPAAEPIQACSDQLAFRKAKAIRPDLAQTMLGSIIALAGSMKDPDPNQRYCRDRNAGVTYGVYRAVGTTDGYLLAIADSGRVASVDARPDIMGKSSKVTYPVTFLELGRSDIFPSFDRLPQPEQVVQLVMSGRPLSSSQIGSTTINLGVPEKP